MCRLILRILIFSLAAVSVTSAQTNKPSDTQTKNQTNAQGFAPGDPMSADVRPRELVPRFKKNFFLAGLAIRNYTYEEKGFVTHNGYMFGVWFQGKTKNDYGLYSLKSNLYYGNLTYDGALCNVQTSICDPYKTSAQTDIISKTNLEAYFEMTRNFSFKAGLGFRYLSDIINEPGFYQRTGTWLFLPLGAELELPLAKKRRLLISLEYDHILNGTIRSNLSDVGSQYDDLSLQQTGSGMNLNLMWDFNQKYTFSVYYETWNLNKTAEASSGGIEGLHEPANTSKSTGLSLGYYF